MEIDHSSGYMATIQVVIGHVQFPCRFDEYDEQVQPDLKVSSEIVF